MNQTTLKRTPLSDLHRKTGGKMVEFFGWDMPVEFESLMVEHNAVRTAVGLFDVSHMGEIDVRGKDALALIQKVTTNNVAALGPGKIQYSALTYPEGTFVDDLLVYFLDENHYLLVVNASNVDKDFEWILSQRSGMNVAVNNVSDEYCQIAVQGPKAEHALQALADRDLSAIGYYNFAWGSAAGVRSILSRTGYTGEDGFEIYCEASAGPRVWEALIKECAPLGGKLCGLGARDTLRLEARLALYGNDIDNTTTVMEADLGWIVKFKKGDFNGRDVLLKQKDAGVQRKLVGFELRDKGIPRHGYPVLVDGREFGKVTSGTFAPFLKKSIGLAYLPVEKTAVGTRFAVEIRGKAVAAEVVPTPFYKRPK